jgi:Insertion element 4 transposase N-terminal/Transposase DDE domain
VASMIRRAVDEAARGADVAVVALGRALDPADVAAAVDACGARERRRRKLPAGLTVVLCVAMNWYAADPLPEVFRRLVLGLRGRWPAPAGRASKAGLCQARRRLGARPLVALFRRVRRPLATAATPGAFLFGRRLVAVDSTALDLPDSAANARAFGRPGVSRGAAAWPQALLVALVECATHAALDAGLWPRAADPHAAARRLLRSVDRAMLVLYDAGLHSAALLGAVRARGAHALGRLPGYVRPEVLRPLADGTVLVRLRAWPHRSGPPVLARLLRYTLDDPARPGHRTEHRLVTTLLNPRRAPALELVCAYHARWELELAVDEVKTHQRPPTPLRSQTPVGVVQEVYALLVAHHAVRAVMADAADAAGLPPTRLSFSTAVRLLRTALPDLQRARPRDRPRLYRQLLAEIAAAPLPPRADRVNPRAVKRKMSNFRLKRPTDRRPPAPRPFRDAVVLLK